MPIPGAIQSSFTPTANGSYKVRFTTIEGCVVFSECYYIGTVATNELLISSDWNIIPNPASDYVDVMLDSQLHDGVDIDVIDMLGKIHITDLLQTGKSHVKINIEGLVTGLYIVRIKDSSGKEVV